jgi:uncharacterized protein YqcC (DUF446 family)
MELTGARNAIAAQLIDLEAELRQLDLWSDTPPAAEALVSEQPFAMDTLEFEEWLQFIFLPTIYDVLEDRAALPAQCAIAPMAEEVLGQRALPIDALVRTLKSLDTLITENE